MPNLVVTRACSLRCAFCFAEQERAACGGCAAADLSPVRLEELIAACDVREVRLCGGEPTEHPRFLKLLEVALAVDDRRVLLMTNGLWPAAVRQGVQALSRRRAERVEYLVNVLPRAEYRSAQRADLEATLRLLAGRKLGLGVTIDRQPYDFTHVLELARRHGARQLRFSIAAPSLVDPATWTLDPECDFAPLARQIHALAFEARRLGLRVQSDCGYLPPCALDDTARTALRDGAHPGEIEWICHGPVDVDASGQAWRCYGLSSLARGRLDAHPTLADLSDHLEEQVQGLAAPWLYDACRGCAWRLDGTCGGGCHALRLVQGLRRQGALVGVDVADAAELGAAVYMVEPDALRPWHRRGGDGWMLRQVDTWVELSLSPVEAAIVGGLAGARAQSLATLALPAVPDADLARALRHLLVRGAIKLVRPAEPRVPSPPCQEQGQQRERDR